MNLDGAWAVVAGVLIACATPFVAAIFEARERRAERRELDQREALRAVQDDMHTLLSGANSLSGLRQSGIHQPVIINDVIQKLAPASASLVRNTERIRDNKTRSNLYGFNSALLDVLYEQDPRESQRKLEILLGGYLENQKTVGESLRKL